jgi:hypothetical protein
LCVGLNACCSVSLFGDVYDLGLILELVMNLLPPMMSRLVLEISIEFDDVFIAEFSSGHGSR